jgi:hypothetical protein
MSPPSSASKNKPRKKPAWRQVASRATCHHSGFFLSLLFDPEEQNHLPSHWFLPQLILWPWRAEPPAFTLVSSSAYSLILKMEKICSSETSVDFQRPTRRYIPEYSILHSHLCENLKSYITGISYYDGIRNQYRIGLRGRSRWPRGLRHELSSPARTLGSWVRTPLEEWMFACVYSMFALSCV